MARQGHLRPGRQRSGAVPVLASVESQEFLSNAARANRAKRRMPSKGFVSIEELAEVPGPLVEPFHGETPEALFNRAWAVTLVTRMLRQMESDARETGKTVHFDIFKHRIVLPLLDGAEATAMRELAERHGLDEKQAANALLTARRAYQRLLRDEIRLYARSEDEVSAEVRDIFRALQRTA